MTTPEQLLDQLAAAERSATGPPAEVRERVWGELRARLDADATAPALDDGPLLEPLGARSVVLKIVGALVFVGVIGGGIALALRDHADAPPSPRPAVAAVPSEHAEPPPEPIAAAEPVAAAAGAATEDPSVEQPAPVEQPKPKSKPKPAPKPAPEPGPGKTLADELALMQALSTALKLGDSKRAQKLIAEHEREFANGQFVEERHAAKARALCMAGKLDRGRELARSFAKRWPGSIHLPVVRTDCQLD